MGCSKANWSLVSAGMHTRGPESATRVSVPAAAPDPCSRSTSRKSTDHSAQSGGAFEARGIFGQHIYINPHEKLVIVVLSARPKPTGATVLDDAAFFAAVARSLR